MPAPADGSQSRVGRAARPAGVKRPRIGLVGARRRRQGLGPFVARALLAAGADIAGFVASSAAGIEAGQRELCRAGVDARGYRDIAALVAAEMPQAVAILSPSDSHAHHLEAALGARVDVLCDKPLVWGDPQLATRADTLISAFADAGLLLRVNCQWPYTLPAFERLHPGTLSRPPKRFEMWMQPASAGVLGLADSLPHPLSLLQALVPGGGARLTKLRFAAADPERANQTLDFHYCTDSHAVDVTVHLERTDRDRRQAAFAIDGKRARRVIRGTSYRLCFADDAGREVPLEDPMTLLLDDFVAALRGERERAPDPRIAARMALLAKLVEAHPDSAGPPP